jgi:hypothetical protein
MRACTHHPRPHPLLLRPSQLSSASYVSASPHALLSRRASGPLGNDDLYLASGLTSDFSGTTPRHRTSSVGSQQWGGDGASASAQLLGGSPVPVPHRPDSSVSSARRPSSNASVRLPALHTHFSQTAMSATADDAAAAAGSYYHSGGGSGHTPPHGLHHAPSAALTTPTSAGIASTTRVGSAARRQMLLAPLDSQQGHGGMHGNSDSGGSPPGSPPKPQGQRHY